MRRVLFLLLVVGAIAAGLIWAGNYDVGNVVITRENEQKIVLRLGEPVKVLDHPGIWWFRIPLIDRVIRLDRRLQFLDAEPVEMVIAQQDKLLVSYYAVWRISDPLEFFRNFRSDMEEARHRIQSKVRALVGDRIGGLTLQQLLSRTELLETLAKEANQDLRQQGVEVVDVRLNRTEIPSKAEPAAFQQMREQRRAQARKLRAEGEREARRIRAEADRDARTTVAEAHRDGDVSRGEGDAQAAHIYAAAYGKDAEFYAFVRSLEAYRKTLGERTTLVLPPGQEFFRFLAPDQASHVGGR